MKKILPFALFALASVSFAESAPVAGYYASAKSDVYHLPECRSAKKIAPGNLIIFPTKEEAQKKGYRPCKVCKP